MEEIRDRSFSGGERVPTDDRTFVNCRFDGAELAYGGGTLPIFQNCDFQATSWYFQDAALRTVQLIQVNGNQEGGRNFIYDLFKPGFYLSE